MRAAFAVLGALVLLCLSPLLIAAAMLLFVRAAGCIPASHAFATCRILGTDGAGALTGSLTLQWLGQVILPVAAVLAACLLLLGLFAFARRGLR